MNWLDIILIILITIILVGGVVISILAWVDGEIGLGFGMLFMAIFISSMFALPFIVLDNGAGSTIGTITSVDKNFFGTTAVYVKTSETTQEKLCIEDKELSEQAKSLIGKEVKVSYGTRVGLYSTGKCSQAPIEKIEVVSED